MRWTTKWTAPKRIFIHPPLIVRSSFDLPIAIGMAAASEQMGSDQLDNFVMVGELALNGTVRPVRGLLPVALCARKEGRTGILVPPENAAEAAVVSGLKVIPVRNLSEAV